jgi:hypothetical protein
MPVSVTAGESGGSSGSSVTLPPLSLSLSNAVSCLTCQQSSPLPPLSLSLSLPLWQSYQKHIKLDVNDISLSNHGKS